MPHINETRRVRGPCDGKTRLFFLLLPRAPRPYYAWDAEAFQYQYCLARVQKRHRWTYPGLVLTARRRPLLCLRPIAV